MDVNAGGTPAGGPTSLCKASRVTGVGVSAPGRFRTRNICVESITSGSGCKVTKIYLRVYLLLDIYLRRGAGRTENRSLTVAVRKPARLLQAASARLSLLF
jgi:hypothetical protein